MLRVLSRLRGIGAEIDNTKVVEHMWKLADEIVDQGMETVINKMLIYFDKTFLIYFRSRVVY